MTNVVSPEFLNELSYVHGFSLSGVTTLEPASTNLQYKKWIKAGYHGSMAYLQNEPGYGIRLMPSSIFSEAKSLILLGVRYPKSGLQSHPETLNGIISSYAWGKDYHQVLRTKAQKLVEDICHKSGRAVQSRITIDSAPVLEKPLAQRAGLGWQGKNTCLISPLKGSFFFIAGIFSDLELEPSPAFEKDYCGSCHKCMDACPTGCILADRTIDARKCISYLTIEHKGSIPNEMRPAMGSMIFGCDICQYVCPWNRKPDDSGVPGEFMPVNEWSTSPGLLSLLSMQADEFTRIYRQSPISRARRSGLLRNAGIAIGNSKALEAVPVLQTVLEIESMPIIRGMAAWALGKMGTRQSRQILSNTLNRESDQSVRIEIKEALES